MIVAHFYDVESGRMELDQRGRGENYEHYDIPIARDGGVTDLLDESTQKGRRFDVVICGIVSRVARRMLEGLSIERELERAEVPLFASNEPITLTVNRAQRILQRRINQSVAGYEGPQHPGAVLVRVVHARARGLEHRQTAVRLQGRDRHPDRNVALSRGLGYGTIADRLNADPTK